MERQTFDPPLRVAGEIRTVALISQHRVAGVGQVYPDLIAAAGFKPDAKPGGAMGHAPQLIMRDRQFPGAGVARGVALKIFSGGQVAFKSALGGQHAMNNGRIFPFRLAFFKLLLQLFSDFTALRKD